MPSPAKLLASASVVSVDPNFRNVTLLLHGDGSNGAQNNTFIDGSTNNFTITRNGNTTQGSFSPYGSRWSNYFDGTGDYLTAPNSTAFDFGSGSFTIEAWVYATSNSPSEQIFYGKRTNNTVYSPLLVGVKSVGGVYKSYILGSTTGSSWDINGSFSGGSSTIPLNTWTHIAVVRNGTTFTTYVNGVQDYQTTGISGALMTNTTAVSVGSGTADGNAPWNGYLSDFRIVKGTAAYTANFTPPIAPLTAISGTSLLTCQSNRFRDASTNNFAITKFNETSITTFSPFSLPAPGYTAAAYGGSGYFDGNGDGLTAPNNAAFNLSNGDFTLECWVYNAEVVSNCGYAGVWGGGYILYREGTTYRFYYGGPAGSPLTPSIAAVAGTWTHLAVVRNGTTLTFYVNGVSGGSTNVSTTAINFSGQPFGIGANFETGSPTAPFTGYMAGLRLVKGTAIYTAAFTPPTTPPTAVSGTSILCNFTNAAVFDNATINDLETAGNAQINTSVKKFGTGSMSFNGSTDWLVTPNKSEHNFGTGDFTIEAWAYPTGTNSQATIISNYNGPSSGWGLLLGSTGPTFGWGDTNLLAGSSALTQNAWNHVAITRSGTSLRMFLNGTQIASATNSTDFTSTGALFIGRLREATAGFYWQGYLDDVRLTKGVARYTANFTPPTAAFPDQ